MRTIKKLGLAGFVLGTGLITGCSLDSGFVQRDRYARQEEQAVSLDDLRAKDNYITEKEKKQYPMFINSDKNIVSEKKDTQRISFNSNDLNDKIIYITIDTNSIKEDWVYLAYKNIHVKTGKENFYCDEFIMNKGEIPLLMIDTEELIGQTGEGEYQNVWYEKNTKENTWEEIGKVNYFVYKVNEKFMKRK